MSAELSYLQLKAANEARVSEEVRVEQRKKNLLVLTLHYLREEGYLDTAQTLVREAGPNVTKYEVCDNIDLPTILQEYESYYQVKFRKAPRIIKRVSRSAEQMRESHGHRTKATATKSTKASGTSLPPIPGTELKGHSDEKLKRPASDGRRKDKRKTSQSQSQTASTGIPSPQSLTTHSPSAVSPPETLGLIGSSAIAEGKKPKKGQVVNVKAVLQDAIRDASAAIEDHQDRLLKPITGFAGYSGEMRELAAVISRDIYLHNPDVHWDDIVGLEAAKRLVKEAVVYPIKYPQLFTGILSPWKGLLLYGPPGTGKTMLAKAVATECKTTFFNISASSIVSKWRGDSEKLVRVLFELARFHAPSTIFMDELESIMGQRAGFGAPGGEHEGSRRMKTELLVQMDGLSKSSDLVFVLAASNIPWELDPAMLRRLEKRILVGLPVESARVAMLKHYLPPVLSQHPFSITTEVDHLTAARLTEGYSGSDIRLVCKEAAMRTVRKVFDKLEALTPEESASGLDEIAIGPVRTSDLEAAIASTKPSAKHLASQYSRWQREYESA